MAKARTLIVDHGRERNRWRAPSALQKQRPRSVGAPTSSPLEPTGDFGPNPGALVMLSHAPEGLASGSPLIVVLHGCSQDARGYDVAAGWSRLADELGFAVLFPEQSVSNNPGGCFNWFLTADASRGLGETRSIREMIERMVERHDIDRGRIFVTGLSAGGAMTSALLADYPDLFAAGAVIAGLPCGSATNVHEAFGAMSQPDEKPAEALGDAVRTASPHLGPWPRVLVLHGTKDDTVAPKNADAIVRQWVNVHGAAVRGYEESRIDSHRRRVWRKDGRVVVESIMLAGMGHGTPLDAAFGERQAPFMLDVGLSSTRRIADFFGIDGALAERPAPAASERDGTDEAGPRPASESRSDDDAMNAGWFGPIDITGAINKALKAAGLMK